VPANGARYLAAIVVVGLATVLLAFSIRPVSVDTAWWIVGGRLVALAVLAAGVVLWFAGSSLAAVAAAVASVSWAGVIWSVERVSGADALVGAGLILAPLLAPALIILILGLPALWRSSRQLTGMLLVASLVIAMTGVVRAFVYDPIRDLQCELFCGHSPVLIVANLGLAAWLGAVGAAATAVVCAIVAFRTAARSNRRSLRRDLAARVLGASGVSLLGVAELAGVVE